MVLSLRCPYHAIVMKVLDINNNSMVYNPFNPKSSYFRNPKSAIRNSS
jgi:hypothetical protein